MNIRIATTPEERAEIFRLRYRVLVEELGWTIKNADHELRQFYEPMDEHSTLVGAFEGDEVIASLRINFARNGDLGPYETLYSIDKDSRYYPEQTGIITKLMVSNEYRRSPVIPNLLVWVYSYGLHSGIAQVYIDCSPDLIHFYERLGFVCYTDDVETEEFGIIAPMRLDITNIDYLERIRSPFCRALSQYQQGQIDAYLESCGRGDSDTLPRWPYGLGSFSDYSDTRIFDGLSADELKRVFRAAATKGYADGEAIFRLGDPSWEFGVVLKGRASVTRIIQGKERVVALFSRGQVLGEMGFLRDVPRSATVTALDECQIAAFPSAVVENLLQKDPGIAVQLFRNLAIILAERLAYANDWPGEVQ